MKRSFRGIALVALFISALGCGRRDGLTYLSITSVPGDSIGQGRQIRLTSANGKFKANHPAPHLVAIQFEDGDKSWTLDLAVPRNAEFGPGTYENAMRHPAPSPTQPGLNISGEGRSCKQLSGRFVVLEAVFGPGTTVERLAVDYEQLCEGDQGALLGAVRINSALRPGQTAGHVEERRAEERPAGEPVRPRTARRRELGTTYLDFDSPPGEYIGQGRQFSFTPDDGTFKASHPATNLVTVNFNGGHQYWTLELAVPARALFRPGIYEKAARYPFQSPTRPGLSVSGEGRGCNTVTGRFIVQEVVFGEGTSVERLAVDYEQSCEEGREAAPLIGSLRINSSIPPGQIPDIQKDAGPPADEARPRGTTYLDFDSVPGDYIGHGRRFTLTPDDGNLKASYSSPNRVSITFNGGSNYWSLDFAVPEKDVFAPGSYEKATRYPFQSPTRPGLSVSGEGRGCNTSTGRFVVIEAAFSGTAVERLAVDYEQNCEGSTEAPLVGSVRINSSASPVIRRQYAERNDGDAGGRRPAETGLRSSAPRSSPELRESADEQGGPSGERVGASTEPVAVSNEWVGSSNEWVRAATEWVEPANELLRRRTEWGDRSPEPVEAPTCSLPRSNGSV